MEKAYGQWAKRQCRNCLAWNKNIIYTVKKQVGWREDGTPIFHRDHKFSEDFPFCRRCKQPLERCFV